MEERFVGRKILIVVLALITVLVWYIITLKGRILFPHREVSSHVFCVGLTEAGGM